MSEFKTQVTEISNKVKEKYDSISPETKQKWLDYAKTAIVAVGVAIVACVFVLGRIFDATQNRNR